MNSDRPYDNSRRGFLQASGALALALASLPGMVGGAVATAGARSASAVTDCGRLSGLTLSRSDTAVVFIDPQNEVLSEKGAAWGVVGESVKENQTVDNMEHIFQAAKQKGFEVFSSPPTTSTPRTMAGNSTDLSRRWSTPTR